METTIERRLSGPAVSMQVRLPAPLHLAIRDYAEREGISINLAVAQAVEFFLKFRELSGLTLGYI